MIASLRRDGHEVGRLLRAASAERPDATWDPAGGTIDTAALEGFDAIVHLAGENIADGRWNDAKKARICNSRVDGTKLLAEALAGLEKKPRVLVSASAVGYYGDRGEETLTESSPAGSGFLPDVSVEWENATEAAAKAGIRVAVMRIGVVIAREGGALAKMLLPFKLGVGGCLGNGRQVMSWIAVDDLLGAIRHTIETDSLEGAVNTTAPRPVTNREYTKALGRVLGRWTIFPMPAFVARLAFGEMAQALLLDSARVVPEKLEASGYTFEHPDVESALRHVLDRPAS